MAAALSSGLDFFLNSCHIAIVELSYANRGEAEPWMDGHGNINRHNGSCVYAIQDLRMKAQKINRLCLKTPGVFQNFKIQRLDEDFSEPSIEVHEIETWSLTRPLLTGESTRSSVFWIDGALNKVRLIEKQALEMYNYLNSDHPRKIPYCRDKTLCCAIL